MQKGPQFWRRHLQGGALAQGGETNNDSHNDNDNDNAGVFRVCSVRGAAGGSEVR